MKAYFQFTTKQARAALCLAIAIIILSISYFTLPYLIKSKVTFVEEDMAKLQIQMQSKIDQDGYSHKNYDHLKLRPFKFDPNTLDSAGFASMQLPVHIVRTILNYRNKGGKFYNSASLKRMYNLPEGLYKQLESYIDIQSSSTSIAKTAQLQMIIELNEADTSALIQLKGIGSKLASNIVQYRNSLGGFSNKLQLKEVYGVTDETYQLIQSSISVSTKNLKRYSLQEATFYELNAHPYLRGEIAQSIVEYRKAHNYKIDNLNQLKEIPLINEQKFRKIVPYLSL